MGLPGQAVLGCVCTAVSGVAAPIEVGMRHQTSGLGSKPVMAWEGKQVALCVLL